MTNLTTQPQFVVPENTLTKPDPFIHPVRAFLSECGVDVSTFPSMRFRIEIPERKQLRPHRVFIPIHLPNNYGLFYESFFRVLRIVEIPDPALGSHRLFMDVEWTVLEQGVPETENHLAYHFLAREFVCPNCKDAFEPNLDKVNALALQIVCPQCLYEWMIRIDSTTEGLPITESLLELYNSEPSMLRQYLNDWSSEAQHSENAAFSSFFPVRFQVSEDAESDRLMRGFYGDELLPIWKIQSNFQQLDFASIVRSLANELAWIFFKKEESTAKLTTTVSVPNDQTDVRRRSEVTDKALVNSLEARRKSLKSTDRATPDKPDLKIVKPLASSRSSGESLGFKLKTIFFGALIFGLTVSTILLSVFFFLRPSVETSLSFRPPQTTLRTPAPLQEAVEKTNALPEVTAAPTTPMIQAEVAATPSLPKVETPRPTPPAPAPQTTARAITAPAVHTITPSQQRALQIDKIFRQGMLHLKLQQSKEAAAAFKQVLAIDSKHTEALRNLGLAYVYGQDFAPAVQAFERYLKLAGNSIDRASVQELLKTLKERQAQPSSASK